jgi:hypothetical protein
MTEHGWSNDAWPAIYQRVLAADIFVIAGPIQARRQQLGDQNRSSSVCTPARTC